MDIYIWRGKCKYGNITARKWGILEDIKLLINKLVQQKNSVKAVSTYYGVTGFGTRISSTFEWPKLLDSELESVGVRRVLLFPKQRHLGPNLLKSRLTLPAPSSDKTQVQGSSREFDYLSHVRDSVS